jgi:aryl-alcohol dehydrogenase-like predicted oxidoreductase
VIDTAANYRGGRAETAVGRALQSLRLLGDAERDQLFISSKAGYPPGELMNGVWGKQGPRATQLIHTMSRSLSTGECTCYAADWHAVDSARPLSVPASAVTQPTSSCFRTLPPLLQPVC